MRPRSVLLLACALAIGVFCVVQDRVTASGAQQYVTLQREALAGRAPAVTLDAVMQPAVTRSVRQGALWGGLVLAAGVIAAGGLGRRRTRERRA